MPPGSAGNDDVIQTLLDTTAPDATILVGAVFLSEGIQKFLFSVTSYGFGDGP
jgi:hypothetical protein